MSILLKYNIYLHETYSTDIKNCGVLVGKLLTDMFSQSHLFLDNIIKNKKETDVEYLLSHHYKYHNLLKTYSKIDELISTVSSIDNDLRYLTDSVPCHVIEKYFDGVKWDYADLMNNKDMTKELYEKIIKLNLCDVPWNYNKPYVTKQFLLDNPSIIPNRMSLLLRTTSGKW